MMITRENLLERGFKLTTSVAVYERGIIRVFGQPNDTYDLENGEGYVKYETLEQLDELLLLVFGVKSA